VIDTTDPRADYPPDQRFVNQGPDRRIPGELGERLALLQRLSAFKSTEPPERDIAGSVDDGYLLEVAKSRPQDKPFIGVAFKVAGRWQTFRLGWRWDPNWGDERVTGYNPDPHIVGGYFFDAIIKLGQARPHITRD
jgi:hypothetical protein